jgi:hypothetical protein
MLVIRSRAFVRMEERMMTTSFPELGLVLLLLLLIIEILNVFGPTFSNVLKKDAVVLNCPILRSHLSTAM